MSLQSEYRSGRWTGDDLSPAQTELATSLRVPFISSDGVNRWNYICPVVVSTDDDSWSGWRGLLPTDAEVRAIGSFIEAYNEHWYNAWFRGLMAEFAPYDIDGAANLAILRKDADTGGWAYRKRTWDRGPRWWPPRDGDPLSLVAVMDRIKSFGDEVRPDWVQWKADHADVFEAVAS